MNNYNLNSVGLRCAVTGNLVGTDTQRVGAECGCQSCVTYRETAHLPARQEQRIDVLDHGFIRLVDHMGSDLSISRAARVSFDAAWRAGNDEGSDERLIRYLWTHKHTTPFESVEFQFEVMAPIFVLRQWMRHRTWSFSELSGRYRELPEMFYLPDPELIGVQATDNKQGRQPGGDIEARRMEVGWLRMLSEDAFKVYHELLGEGWPRELARSCLPLNTYSHMFAKVDLRNLLGFLDLRSDPHAQYEIRVYAEAIEKLIEPIVPVAFAAWKEGRNANA